MAARPAAGLESSVLAPGSAVVVRDYEQPSSPPAPLPPPAAASSISSAPVPGSFASPPQGLSDSVVHLAGDRPPEAGQPGTPTARLLPTEAASPSPSPSSTPAASILGSSGPHSLDSPERRAGPPPAQPSAISPAIRSGSLTPTGDEDIEVYSMAYRVAERAYKITQHFVIRSPHVFIAITTTFLAFKYLNDEPFAWEAATYVGVASAVYCIIRPLFLMIIPYSLLPRKTHDFWRHAINTTNTIFITISLTTAVWGLKISAVQGTAIWAGSFVVPYKLLSKHYPDLDGQFPNSLIREERKA